MPPPRSSVRPSSSKQPWGTILKPDFGMGYQRLSEDQIDQTVKRLHTPCPRAPKARDQRHPARCGKKLSQDQIDAMLERVTKFEREKVADSDRRIKSSIYKDMGVVSSYAWKGYN